MLNLLNVSLDTYLRIPACIHTHIDDDEYDNFYRAVTLHMSLHGHLDKIVMFTYLGRGGPLVAHC